MTLNDWFTQAVWPRVQSFRARRGGKLMLWLLAILLAVAAMRIFWPDLSINTSSGQGNYSGHPPILGGPTKAQAPDTAINKDYPYPPETGPFITPENIYDPETRIRRDSEKADDEKI